MLYWLTPIYTLPVISEILFNNNFIIWTDITQYCYFGAPYYDHFHLQILEGHTSYINDLTFDPDQGEQLASTSDDLSCRIWSRDGSQVTCFQLGSPGMSIGWHRDDPMKVWHKAISKFRDASEKIEQATTTIWCSTKIMGTISVTSPSVYYCIPAVMPMPISACSTCTGFR